MKTVISMLLFICLTSCQGTRRNKYAEIIKPLKNSSIFSDFQFIGAPRENIGIGSEWTKFGPPSVKPIKVELIELKSFSNYEIQSNSVFNTNLKVNLLNFFGVKGDLNILKSYVLLIDSIVIVRVADIKQLNFSTGKIYIWEGIKVKSITLTASTQAIDTLNFKSLIGSARDIQFSQVSDYAKNVSIKGINLFCAYRLVKIGEAIEKKLTLTIGTYKEIINNDQITGIKSFTNSTDYNGVFYKKDDYIKSNYTNESEFIKEQDNKYIWPETNYNSNCSWVLEIECINELINDKPKLLKYKVCCKEDYKAENFKFNLQTRMIDNLLVRDVLFMKNIHNHRSNDIYSSKTSALSLSNGSITMKRYTIPIENYIDLKAKGL